MGCMWGWVLWCCKYAHVPGPERGLPSWADFSDQHRIFAYDVVVRNYTDVGIHSLLMNMSRQRSDMKQHVSYLERKSIGYINVSVRRN
jgi:hypothetical protein